MADKLKVSYRRVEDLIPYARNARTHSDDQVARIAGWDNEMLSLELGDLKDAGGDLGLTGFSDEELDELLATPTEGADGDVDEAPEP